MKTVPIELSPTQIFTALVKFTEAGLLKIHKFIPGLGECPDASKEPYNNANFSSVEKLKKWVIANESNDSDEQG